MTTPLERAATRVAQQYKRNPEAVQLAKLASLAVRVEPHLLRRLRLSLLPDADVGIEADLWFGPLVESRGVRTIVLNRHVVELLREELCEERQLLQQVIALTEQAHAGAAATLRLEERLTVLALLNEPDAVLKIDEALRPALRTMQSGGDDARKLAQWAMRALPQAHPKVRESRNAITLALSATLALGGRPILGEAPDLQGGFGDMGWLLRGAAAAQPIRIGVEFVEAGVAFMQPGGEQPQLELPATRPLVLSLAWKTDAGEARMLVDAAPGRTVELDAGVTQVVLGTLSGDEYLLSAPPDIGNPAEAPVEDLGTEPFETDVYISYSAIDNQPVAPEQQPVQQLEQQAEQQPEQQGWVTRFHASLEAMLSMRLGRKARIWRDQKFAANDSFAEDVQDALARTAVLVCVVTPRYLLSEWCMKEVRDFCALAERHGGLVTGNLVRVCKVIKAPSDTRGSLPAVVEDTLGWDFYTMEDGAPVELDPAYGEKFTQAFNLKLAKLAWEIANLLKKLDANGNARGKSDAAPGMVKATIYLAECSSDRRDARERVERELRQRGCRVLPDRELPGYESEYVEEVRQLMRQCQLSVHLVGSHAGTTLEGPSGKPVVELQNDVAAEYSRSAALQRLIWLPEGTQSHNAKQQQFIERLLLSEEARRGADIITGDFQVLKEALLDILEKVEVSSTPQPPISKLIYLICDERDRPATIPLRKFCRQHGFTVELPLFEDDAVERRTMHDQLLAVCDAVILFYGAGSESWKRRVEMDLRKIPAIRDKPLRASFTYIAGPTTDDKSDLIDFEGPNLINGMEGFSEAAMKPLLEALQSGRTTA